MLKNAVFADLSDLCVFRGFSAFFGRNERVFYGILFVGKSVKRTRPKVGESQKGEKPVKWQKWSDVADAVISSSITMNAKKSERTVKWN
jgi:hypothetical protein